MNGEAAIVDASAPTRAWLPLEPTPEMLTEGINAPLSREPGMAACDYIDLHPDYAKLGAWARNNSPDALSWKRDLLTDVYRAMVSEALRSDGVLTPRLVEPKPVLNNTSTLLHSKEEERHEW